MTPAINELTATTQGTPKSSAAAAQTAASNTDQTSFGALLHQTVQTQRDTATASDASTNAAAKTGATTKSSSATQDASASEDTDDAAKKTGDASDADKSKTPDANTALMQALAALGLAPKSVNTTATQSGSATTSQTGATDSTDGTAAIGDANQAGTATSANARTGIDGLLKSALATAQNAAATDTTAGAADVASPVAAAKAGTGTDALTAHLAAVLKTDVQDDSKTTDAATLGNTTSATQPSDLIGNPAAANGTTNTNAANSANVAQQTIHSQFGSSAWANEVTQQVRSFTLQKIDVAELKLNPQDLGPIRVQIALDQGNAAIHFSAARDDVRDALAQNIGNLRNSLADAGVNLQNASTGNFGEGQAFAFMQQQSGNNGSRGASTTAGSSRGSSSGSNDTDTSAVASVTPRARTSAAGGVDLFA